MTLWSYTRVSFKLFVHEVDDSCPHQQANGKRAASSKMLEQKAGFLMKFELFRGIFLCGPLKEIIKV